MTNAQWLERAEAQLADAGVLEPRLDAQMLLAESAGWTRSQVLARLNDPYPGGADQMVARRIRREPLAYVLGWREFYGRRFAVGRGCLIPRQETELLVELALRFEWDSALDVGTGSGCLAATLKHERSQATIVATDIEDDALRWAAENTQGLGIELHKADLWPPEPAKFDLIVSNPPYIAPGESLPAEIAAFEPKSALFSGQDGLDAYRRLAEEAHDWLSDTGHMIVEIGDRRCDAGTEIFARSGWQTGIQPDLAGRPRAWVLSRPLP